VLDFGMAWCSFCCPTQACSLAGREHGRSIPFSEIGVLIDKGPCDLNFDFVNAEVP
jgi:hypothetical protein